jgi:transcription antitermination protein NusB
MANRHLSRSIVLQTLFEWDFSLLEKKENVGIDDIKKILNRNLKEFGPGLEDDNFVFSLVEEILKKKNIIDEIIKTSAPEWPLDKISIIDRNILRIGLYELLFGDKNEVPPKVAINEAIELAKTFGGENSGKFVNGVLGAVYKELGEPGKDQKSKNHHHNQKDKNTPVDVKELPVENLGGAVIYSKKPAHDGGEDEYMLAFVHDVFGYWTLSKGKLAEGEDISSGTVRKIKEEIGLDIEIKEKLGENEYVATHPERGRSLKKVTYFLASSEYKDLVLEESGGLDNARWFPLFSIPELRIYNDIVPLIKKAIEIISGRK